MSNARTVWLCAAISLVVATVGATVGVAAANHVFSDVPTSSAFHDAITNVNAAGCVSGFPDGTFHPTDNVRRQQAAFWLDACLGRVAHNPDDGSFTNTPGGDVFENQLVIHTGGLPDVGSGGVVLVLADVDVDTSGEQQSTWTLEEIEGAGPGVDLTLDEEVVTVTDPGLTLNPSDSTLLVGFVQADSGDDAHFRLSAQRNGGVPLANLRTTLSAIWFPFDAAGSL